MTTLDFAGCEMHLNINIRTPVARRSEADFVVQLLTDVLAPGEFSEMDTFNLDEALQESDGLEPGLHDEIDAEFVVGRIWAERLDWLNAEECGYTVASVCDAASGTWIQVLETLSRNGGRTFRDDLQLDGLIVDIIFVHEILLHPEIADRIAVVDAAIRQMAGEQSVVLMYHEQTEPRHLEDWECRDLGFKKIARSNLLIKDSHNRYPFGVSYAAGRHVSFAATAEHEQWVLENWENLIADHPSL